MSDDPLEMVGRLTKYVDELAEARSQNKPGAIKGRTQLILNVLEKLRKAHSTSPLSLGLIDRIQKEKKRAALELPETSGNYQSICWDCYKTRGIKVLLDKRVDSVCRTCGWVQCPECGACRDPKFGGCPDRSFKVKGKIS